MTVTRAHSLRLLLLLGFALGAGAIFVALLRLGGGLDLGAKYHVEAVVPSAVQLVPQADVKLAGATIGKVDKIDTRGSTAVLDLVIDRDKGPVYGDARVRVRTKTLIGESYVDLDPGTSRAGAVPDRGVLPIDHAQDSVQLDQILSVLTPTRRRDVRRVLAGMRGGFGVDGGHGLNGTLEAAAVAVHQAAPVAEALAAEREQVAGLVQDFGTVFSALGEQRDQIRLLVDRGRASARAFAAEDASVATGLRQLPPTLAQAHATTRRLAGVGRHAVPVLDDLTATLNRLTPAARSLPAASRATLRALRRLHRVTPRAHRLLRALRSTTPALEAATPPLGSVLRELRPLLAYLEPYVVDAAPFFSVLRAGAGVVDATSHMAHVKPGISDSLTVTMPENQRRVVRLLLKAGVVQLLQGSRFADVDGIDGVNGYPAPGSAASPKPFSGRYPHVARDR